MSLFTIGDLHLSLGEDKPMDIFSGWKDYVNRIYENWQKQVSQEDTVVIVGDISWAMRLSDAKEDFNFINNLNGTKIILKGNHDYWFDTKTKTDLFLQNNNFNSIKILFNNSYEYENYSICGTRGWINETGEDDVKIINREVGRLKLSLQS
ncbi:MAG: metallophosphoesterase, partial [Oscillospiraceae bacterium]